jgi:hypothetical protein
MRRLLLAVGLAVCATGCEPALVVGDDQGAEGSAEALSQPYATGTEVVLEVGGRARGEIVDVVSDAPALFAIDRIDRSDGHLKVRCRAVGEGDTRIRLRDGGAHERLVVSVAIRTPDRVRFFDAATLRTLGRDERARADAAEITAATVLTGGRAVFGVVYQRGAERLYGRGIAEVGAPAEVTVENATAPGRPIGEWLFVTPSTDGVYSVAVRRGATTLGAIQVTAVPESAVAGLSLVEQDDAVRAKPDEEVWVVERGLDASGAPVLGVYSDFTLDGIPQTGRSPDDPTRGDLYRYVRAAESAPTKTLVARHGALEASRAIPAASGYVQNTTYLGCSAIPGDASARGRVVAVLVAAIALSLGLRRRARG